MLDAPTCYRAMTSRDARFDGLFFVGVSTTGVYCRPICSARTPRRDRCSFFRSAAEAERAGYRACFLCRPELAPGLAPLDGVPRLVARALALVEDGFLNERSLEELAAELGVTDRHLRRTMQIELGVSPVELAQTRRLAMAKQLLQDSQLPLTELAFASGFRSVRRFNALFRARFGRSPTAVRRAHAERDGAGRPLLLRLDYRPPLDWPALLAFFRQRAIPGVEEVTDDEYRRTVRLGGETGELRVRHHPTRPALVASASLSLARQAMQLAARVRALFDLDARPQVIAETLAGDRLLRPLLRARPGLRLPGCFDPFELMVRAVLGQQISVAAARTLAGRLARLGEARSDEPGPLARLFPGAQQVAGASARQLASIGLTGARAQALLAAARAVAEDRLRLDAASPEETLATLARLPGFGPWTAQLVAMRALRWPDAFPAGDAGLRRALGGVSARDAERRAESWRPWRAYAAVHLWRSLSEGARR
jgi:AraC family transcriptional regulator, regulatory protein of adaptative response / DNA-3-methyladenine glycosylase II